MLKWLTGGKETQIAAKRLYDAIVAQSRLPVFYLSHGVADTITGRFEMIVLHMFVVLERLQAEAGNPHTVGDGDQAAKLGQALNEAFVSDLDDAMREMGVADIRVSKRMHEAAGAFFGRLMAYRQALAIAPGLELDHGGVDRPFADDPLAHALARNVLASEDGASDDRAAGAAFKNPTLDGEAAALALAAYTRAAMTALAACPMTVLGAGDVAFPLPRPMPTMSERP